MTRMQNESKVLQPYLGRNLASKKDSYNAYTSSTRAVVEQAIRMLICRFGIFWCEIRYSLRQTILIIVVAWKPHNFLTDTSNENLLDNIPHQEDNHMSSTLVVHFKDGLYTERDNMRARNRARESSQLRDQLAHHVYTLGLVRRG